MPGFGQEGYGTSAYRPRQAAASQAAGGITPRMPVNMGYTRTPPAELPNGFGTWPGLDVRRTHATQNVDFRGGQPAPPGIPTRGATPQGNAYGFYGQRPPQAQGGPGNGYLGPPVPIPGASVPSREVLPTPMPGVPVPSNTLPPSPAPAVPPSGGGYVPQPGIGAPPGYAPPAVGGYEQPPTQATRNRGGYTPQPSYTPWRG